ncbi:5168_t:CDS:1, partial [Cetraspora pellucida]
VYPYLSIEKQLCHPHYCQIVEADRSQRKRELDKKKITIQKKRVLEPIEPSNNDNTG